MSYKIGDLSKLLAMSAETIRFYETKNIVKPHRLLSNEYRIYETWDVFRLMECNLYKSFNFSLKEVVKQINEGSLQNMLDSINKKKTELFNKIKLETMVIEKMEQFVKKYETMLFNLGKYWIQNIPERLYIYFLESDGDNYGDIDINNRLFSQWIKSFPLVTSCYKCSIEDVNGDLNKFKWGFSVEKRYAEALKLSLNKNVINEPEKICITTSIDIGEKGELSMRQLEPIISCAKQNNYKTENEIFGDIIVRTHENGKSHRFIELMLPIQKQEKP
jgi:DNA-binding transcriptional MerR regulator